METNKQTTLAQKDYFNKQKYAGQIISTFQITAIPQIIATTLLAPLQRWRITSQTQHSYPLLAKKYTNFTNYLTRIQKQQGVLSLWRGNGASIWIYIHQTLLQFFLYDNLKATSLELNEELADTPMLTKILDNLVFPFIASFFTLSIIHPLDTYRVQLSMTRHRTTGEAAFQKFRHRAKQISSVKNFYNGFFLANAISVINFNFYKNLYNAFSGFVVDNNYGINGQLVVSTLAVGLVHPIDSFKKVFQLNNMERPELFTNYRSVFKHLSQNKILGTLYNGFFASIGRTLIFAPLYFTILNNLPQNKTQAAQPSI